MTQVLSPDVAEFLANLGNDGGQNARLGRSPEDKARRRRIGKRVRQLRMARSWSRAELAGRVSVRLSPSTVAEIEAGRSVRCRGSGRADIVGRIAVVLGTTLAGLEREESAA